MRGGGWLPLRRACVYAGWLLWQRRGGKRTLTPDGFDILYFYPLNNDPTYVDSYQIEIGTQQTELLG
jgi:hypothetical protein